MEAGKNGVCTILNNLWFQHNSGGGGVMGWIQTGKTKNKPANVEEVNRRSYPIREFQLYVGN